MAGEELMSRAPPAGYNLTGEPHWRQAGDVNMTRKEINAEMEEDGLFKPWLSPFLWGAVFPTLIYVVYFVFAALEIFGSRFATTTEWRNMLWGLWAVSTFFTICQFVMYGMSFPKTTSKKGLYDSSHYAPYIEFQFVTWLIASSWLTFVYVFIGSNSDLDLDQFNNFQAYAPLPLVVTWKVIHAIFFALFFLEITLFSRVIKAERYPLGGAGFAEIAAKTKKAAPKTNGRAPDGL